MVRAVNVDDNELVLDDGLRIDAGNGPVPKGLGRGVVISVKTRGDAGVPVAESRCVAGDDNGLTVGCVDKLFKQDGRRRAG